MRRSQLYNRLGSQADLNVTNLPRITRKVRKTNYIKTKCSIKMYQMRYDPSVHV